MAQKKCLHSIIKRNDTRTLHTIFRFTANEPMMQMKGENIFLLEFSSLIIRQIFRQKCVANCTLG